MPQSDWVDQLMGHNTWATRVLIDDAHGLPSDSLHARFDIGPGSLHDTLRHILGAMLRWADRIGARPLRESIEKGGNLTPQQLIERLEQADSELRAVAAEVGARDGWNEPMEFVDGPTTYRFSRRAAMLHVLTHGMHHRAQAVHIRKRLGLAPLGLDLDVVEYECVLDGQIKR